MCVDPSQSLLKQPSDITSGTDCVSVQPVQACATDFPILLRGSCDHHADLNGAWDVALSDCASGIDKIAFGARINTDRTTTVMEASASSAAHSLTTRRTSRHTWPRCWLAVTACAAVITGAWREGAGAGVDGQQTTHAQGGVDVTRCRVWGSGVNRRATTPAR